MDDRSNEVSFPIGTTYMVTGIRLETKDIANEASELYIGHRYELNDSITWDGPYAIKSFNTQKMFVPVRASGRWFRLRFRMPSSARLSLLGYQYEFVNMGVR